MEAEQTQIEEVKRQLQAFLTDNLGTVKYQEWAPSDWMQEIVDDEIQTSDEILRTDNFKIDGKKLSSRSTYFRTREPNVVKFEDVMFRDGGRKIELVRSGYVRFQPDIFEHEFFDKNFSPRAIDS